VYCSVFKFKNDTPGMCCADEKVKLLELHALPKPISTLISGGTSQSKHFLANIWKCNYIVTLYLSSCGSLLPLPDADHKFISWETLMNKSINVSDSIPALYEKLSLHYKLYSINTTNEFKRLQFPVLLTFAMTINKAQEQ